jgi:hypothetical protein
MILRKGILYYHLTKVVKLKRPAESQGCEFPCPSFKAPGNNDNTFIHSDFIGHHLPVVKFGTFSVLGNRVEGPKSNDS